MSSMVPYAPSGNYQDYYQKWVFGADLYQKLLALPADVVDGSGMASRHNILVNQWIDPNHHKGGIKEPGSLGPNVDQKTIGEINSWIKQARTLIYYIDYDGSQKRSYAQSESDINDVEEGDIAHSVSEIPGYSSQWHWPWIDGWDDPKKRKALLKSNTKKISIKKVAITIGIAGAAIWAGSKFFGKKKNPEELVFEESDFD